MRIAISGTHCSGKTSLVEVLSRALPRYEIVDEPYVLLEEEGHEFAEVPCFEDFERQLDRSIENLLDCAADTIFDRCPADFVAYLAAGHRDEFDVSDWLPRVREAMRRIDLLVFVPLEDPDRIRVPESESPGLRRRMHEELSEILLQDRWGLAGEVLEVTGALRERVDQVLLRIDRARA